MELELPGSEGRVCSGTGTGTGPVVLRSQDRTTVSEARSRLEEVYNLFLGFHLKRKEIKYIRKRWSPLSHFKKSPILQ